MSAIAGTPKKNMMLFSGRAHPELAEHVAKELDVTVTPQSAYSFANGEIFCRFEESVRGSDAFVIQAHSAPINDAIMRRAGSPEVPAMTAVAEGLAYESPRGTVEVHGRHLRQQVFLAVADGVAWDVVQQL